MQNFAIYQVLEHSALPTISHIAQLGTDNKTPNLHKGATRKVW
jgi:hypothetical protein